MASEAVPTLRNRLEGPIIWPGMCPGFAPGLPLLGQLLGARCSVDMGVDAFMAQIPRYLPIPGVIL